MLDFKNKKYKLRCGFNYEYYATVGIEDKKFGTYIHGAYFHPFNGWIPISHYIDGTLLGEYYYPNKQFDLVEKFPFEDFKIDDLVMVSDFEIKSTKSIWYKRYFAGISDTGYPLTFVDGATSWSSGGRIKQWTYCRKPSEEEFQ